MTISAQNTHLPHLGADLRPAQPEASRRVTSALAAHSDPYKGPVALSLEAVNLLAAVEKHTCAPDDGSAAGPWTTAPAILIDGHDKRVLRAGGL